MECLFCCSFVFVRSFVQFDRSVGAGAFSLLLLLFLLLAGEEVGTKGIGH